MRAAELLLYEFPGIAWELEDLEIKWIRFLS